MWLLHIRPRTYVSLKLVKIGHPRLVLELCKKFLLPTKLALFDIEEPNKKTACRVVLDEASNSHL